MNSTKLVNLSSIVGKFKGVLERAKMAFEETEGLKCNKTKPIV